jgi:hypothetical protein
VKRRRRDFHAVDNAWSLYQLQRKALLYHHQQQQKNEALPYHQYQQQQPVSSSNNSSNKKKRVSFATTATVRTRPVSDEDLQNSWYSHADYRHFERDRRETVSAVRAVNGDLSRLNPRECTVAGLERQLDGRQFVTRKIRTARHVQTVLEQQWQQRRRGYHDSQELRSVSELFSRDAGRTAHIRGVLDHALTI